MKKPIRKVCIIGAGALGLSTAYYLKKLSPEKNYLIDIIEASDSVGGLADVYELSNGEKIESFYHHIFKSDKYFINLSDELGLSNLLRFRKASVGHYLNGNLFNLSTPLEILNGNLLSPLNRVRFLIAAAYLKLGINKYLNGIDALSGSRKLFGKEISKKIWIPLLKGKFKNKYKLVPFSWLAARIRDRTLKLGFMENSFDNFYKSLADKCIQLGVNFKFQTPLKNIEISEETIKVNDEKYDLCFSTIGPIKEKEIIPSFKYPKFEYLGAICVIFELDFNLNIPYWINYCDEKSPVLAVINHRKLDNSKRFKDIYPIYTAAYLEHHSAIFKLKDEDIVNIFFKSLKNVSKAHGQNFSFNYKSAKVFRAKYAQPLINPSIGLDQITYTDNKLFRASMHSIYPNDRGQNYSIKIGHLMAKKIDNFMSNR